MQGLLVLTACAHALIAPPARLRARTAPRATSGDYLAGLGQSTIEEVDAVVIGCGPAGLAAAVELKRRGFDKVVALERRDAPDEFEVAKAYLYLVDRRGQRWTDAVGATDGIRERGVSNEGFSLTRIYPDEKGIFPTKPVLARPGAAQAVWIPRASLLAALAERASDDGADLRFGVSVDNLCAADDGAVDIACGATTLRTPLVVGADGARSRVRDFLAKELPASSFEPRELASPSAGLTYKMLQVPPSFDVTNTTDGSTFTTRSRDAYTVPSRSTKPNTRRLRLGLLPSRDPELPRTANIIRPANHEIWGCATGAEVREFLRSEFPQLPDAVVSDEACEAFAIAEPGAFPSPQYVETVAATVGAARCFLVGDAIHAFPPDLGQGVNAALEDVKTLGDVLDDQNAVAAYQAARAPAAKAIAHLVQRGFPYQYDQSVWRQRLFTVGLVGRVAANALAAKLLPEKIAKRVAPPPAAFSVIDGEDYVSVWKHIRRATRATSALAIAFLARAVL